MISQFLVYGTAYILGAIPIGRLTAKLLSGEDIWEYGDGTGGFVNLLNVLGIEAALLKVTLEFGKGIVLGYLLEQSGLQGIVPVLALILILLGYCRPLGMLGKEGSALIALYGYIWYLIPGIGGLSLALFFAVILLKHSLRKALKVSAITLLLGSAIQGDHWLTGLILLIVGFCSLSQIKEQEAWDGTFTTMISNA